MERTKTLDELAREARLDYYRDYRAKNKEKIKKTNAEYWKRRALKLQAKEGGGESEWK